MATDYITTREYADMHGLPIETVRTWTKQKKIPFIKVGNSLMIERSTPIPAKRKKRSKIEIETDKALAAVDSKMLHVEIKHAYYIAVCDKSGKELVSDFTFLSKAEAEAIGKRMKKEVEDNL